MANPLTFGVNLGVKLLRNRKKIKAVAKVATGASITGEVVQAGILNTLIDAFVGTEPANQGEDLFLANLKNSGYATVESENIQNLKNKVEDEYKVTDIKQPRPQIHFQPKNLFATQNQNPFSANLPNPNIPVLPKRLIESKTKKTYTSEITESLGTRKYGFLLGHIFDTTKMYYNTGFPDVVSVEKFYYDWGNACLSYASKMITPEGRFKNGITSNSLVTLRLPNANKSVLCVGENNLMALCDFYETRNYEVNNFKISGLIPTEMEVVIASASEEGDVHVEGVGEPGQFDQIVLKDNQELLLKIYNALGGDFWDRLDTTKNELIKNNQIGPQNLNPEEILRKEILKQKKELTPEEKKKLIENLGLEEATVNTGKEFVTPKITNILDYINALNTPNYFRLGGHDYPITVPENLTQVASTKEAIKTIQLAHLSRFQSWFVKVFDEILGQYPLAIDIADSDLIQTGDQLAQLRYPNVAEAMTEMLGSIIQSQNMLEALLTAAMKNLAETGNNKIMAVKICYAVDAILTWLGFKTKEVPITVPFNYKIPHTEEEINAEGVPAEDKKRMEEDREKFKKYYISTFLENSIERVLVEEIDEEKHNLQSYLTEFTEVAQICKSALTRGVPKGKEKDFLIDLLKNLSQAKKDNSFEKTSKLGDFNDFIEQVEDGFINSTGITNSTKPYGQDFAYRPKIKKIDPPEKNNTN